jgi:hypothetical protein
VIIPAMLQADGFAAGDPGDFEAVLGYAGNAFAT